jgi:hypothetical protein
MEAGGEGEGEGRWRGHREQRGRERATTGSRGGIERAATSREERGRS